MARHHGKNRLWSQRDMGSNPDCQLASSVTFSKLLNRSNPSPKKMGHLGSSFFTCIMGIVTLGL